MFKQAFVWLTVCALGTVSCQSKPSDKTTSTGATSAEVPTAAASAAGKPADNAAIMARKQVPVVCYHQIRDWRPKDSKNAKDYIVQIAAFKEHIKMLADSGYHTILPDQLYAYLTTGAALPKKPIMLTFDDTDEDQYTIAAPELKKYGFKAVYFVMTVSLGRPHYMTKEQVKALSDAGNVIGSHTWDHHMTSKYKHDPNPKKDDWVIQLDKPTQILEEITGTNLNYFANPFAIWKKPVLAE